MDQVLFRVLFMVNTFHLHKHPMSRDCCIITQFRESGEKEESLGKEHQRSTRNTRGCCPPRQVLTPLQLFPHFILHRPHRHSPHHLVQLSDTSARKMDETLVTAEAPVCCFRVGLFTYVKDTGYLCCDT